MSKHSDKYTIMFAAIVTVTCSVILASAATLLKSRQQENIALDKRKNILMAFGFEVVEKSKEEINELFTSKIEPIAIDSNGNQIGGVNADQVEGLNSEAEQKKSNDADKQHPIFLLKDKQGQIESFVIPIHGKGLWSTLYGYLALENDGSSVRGITYYQHGETPGLGAEVDNPDWKKQFQQNKKVYNKGELVSIKVVKGKDTSQDSYAVNSISGATITSKGVETMLKDNLGVYSDYLKKNARVRRQK